ncbi:MAG: oxidoreductase [Mesorhizobium amorphae]|nr:MAG: oxidoreductase [Mesorhizobium amorphae]
MRSEEWGGGASVSVIGQGTWQLEGEDRSDALQTLRRGLDCGMTHVDTAEMYGSGAAEELVAEALAGRRDEVFLVSKVLPSNASRRGTVEACERSLKRLATDRLDCFLLHWRGRFPLEDTIAGFEELKSAGKILSWGVSNFDAEDLDEALAVAGPGRIACNQVLYHLGERAAEHAVMPWCAKNGVGFVAYSPFGQGDFPEPHSAGGRVLAEIARAHDATPRQVALAFLTRAPATFAIPKASHPSRAEDNAGAGDLRLEPEEIERIDRAFPKGAEPAQLPMI